jgi:CRISPR/Cas system-associated endoribonuclease Cas2
MNKQMMEALKEDLLSVINTKKDFLFVYPLCDDCSNSVYIDGTGDVVRISSFEIM